jgi:hypothetical protein
MAIVLDFIDYVTVSSACITHCGMKRDDDVGRTLRFRRQQTEEKQNVVVIVPDNRAISPGDMKVFTGLFNRLLRR